jgi:hypothetical protein
MHYWLVTDSWIVCGWIVSLAQAFLHCKTFSSDVAEYQICEATFYSTQQWIGPLFRLKKKWAALTENHKVKQCKRSFAFSIRCRVNVSSRHTVGIWLPEKHDPFLMIDRPTHSQINNSCLKIYSWQNTHVTVMTVSHCTSKEGRYAMGSPSTFF